MTRGKLYASALVSPLPWKTFCDGFAHLWKADLFEHLLRGKQQSKKKHNATYVDLFSVVCIWSLAHTCKAHSMTHVVIVADEQGHGQVLLVAMWRRPHCPRRPRAPPRSNIRLLFAAHLRCSTTPPHKKIVECPSSQWDASAMLHMAGVKRPEVEREKKGKTKQKHRCSAHDACIAQPDAARTNTCERYFCL